MKTEHEKLIMILCEINATLKGINTHLEHSCEIQEMTLDLHEKIEEALKGIWNSMPS